MPECLKHVQCKQFTEAWKRTVGWIKHTIKLRCPSHRLHKFLQFAVTLTSCISGTRDTPQNAFSYTIHENKNLHTRMLLDFIRPAHENKIMRANVFCNRQGLPSARPRRNFKASSPSILILSYQLHVYLRSWWVQSRTQRPKIISVLTSNRTPISQIRTLLQ